MVARKFVSRLTEIVQRVPPNQMEKFKKFRDKTLEYQRRVASSPTKLPRIDWDYYRHNVRKEHIGMVDEFQIKYEELDKVFEKRSEMLDHKKYYEEIDCVGLKVQEEIKQFIVESNKMIAKHEAEIKRLKSLTPYDQMTMEQFILERPEITQYIPVQDNPIFWPHDEEEQGTEPAEQSVPLEKDKEK